VSQENFATVLKTVATTVAIIVATVSNRGYVFSYKTLTSEVATV
jgi:hypothetical protein